MAIHNFIIYALFIMGSLHLTLSQGVGKVFIGIDINDTTTLYSFNENYLNAANNLRPKIPVYVAVLNETTGEILPEYTNERISLSCEIVTKQEGFTSCEFLPVFIFIPSQTSAEIPIDVQNGCVFGRPSDIVCWGESVSVPPNGQFRKETSLSKPVSLELRPAGKANLINQMEIVPNREIIDTSGTFIVQLSEAVELENITVTCQTVRNSDALDIEIPVKEAYIGNDRVLMNYIVRSKGNFIQVYCTAQSNNCNQGCQFQSSNSNGTVAMFALDEGTVNLYPVVTELSYTSMVAYLVLDEKPVQDVTFYCNLTLVETLDEARAIRDDDTCFVPDDATPTRAPGGNATTTTSTTAVPPTVTGSTTTTAAPAVSNGTWSLDSSTIIFSDADDTIYKSVVIRRTNRRQAISPELIVVRCCAPSELNTDPKYENKSSSFLAIAYIDSEKAINWTAASEIDELEIEREVKNPAYVEVSPCPCDVTSGFCDLNCCCDQDCDADDNSTFTCIPGIEGGYGKNEELKYRCEADYFNKPDYFPLMCVQIENSGYLGLYIYPKSAIRNNNEYNDAVADYVPDYSYRDTQGRFPSSESQNPGYIDGISVKTGVRDDVADLQYLIGRNFRLTLPQPIWNGQCVNTAPVRFLVESDNTCVSLVTEPLCSDFSVLSTWVYARSTQVSANKNAPLVLKENSVGVVTYTDVNYFCLNETEVASYLSSTDKRSDIVTPDARFLFAKDVNTTGCYFDDRTGAYLCEDFQLPSDGGSTPSYQRCSWDDGFTKPLPPVYDDSGAIAFCNNAVVDVLYNFTWKGTEIVRLDATILIADLPLISERVEKVDIVYNDTTTGDITINSTEITLQYPTNVSQHVQVLFSHEFNESVWDNVTSDSDAIRPATDDVYQRSGNPGYEFTLPLVSGVAMYEVPENETVDEFVYVNTNLSASLGVWEPGQDGLCVNAGKRRPEFGVNQLSSCILRLSLEELLDCDSLRKTVLNQQDQLMLSDYISLGGDPNKTSLADWVKILREDVSEIVSDGEESGPDDMTTVSYETTPESNITTAPEVTTATPDFNSTEPGFSYLDYVTGRCTNITSGVHVDIMYALTGKSNNQPIFMIVGAKISYTLSTWKMRCSGADTTSCFNTSDWIGSAANKVQTFTVTSSVNFIEVPPQYPQSKTEYEERHSKRLAYCEQDICWEELAYPLTQAFRGDPWFYSLGFGLVSIVFLVGLFLITRPWW